MEERAGAASSAAPRLPRAGRPPVGRCRSGRLGRVEDPGRRPLRHRDLLPSLLPGRRRAGATPGLHRAGVPAPWRGSRPGGDEGRRAEPRRHALPRPLRRSRSRHSRRVGADRRAGRALGQRAVPAAAAPAGRRGGVRVRGDPVPGKGHAGGLPQRRRLRGPGEGGDSDDARGDAGRGGPERARGTRRRGLPHRTQVARGGRGCGPAQDGGVQRRRRGAGLLQGPRPHGLRSPRDAGGDGAGGVRHGRGARVRVPALRVPRDVPRAGGSDLGSGGGGAAGGRRDGRRLLLSRGRSPRRRGLHLRRGDVPPQLLGGQASLPPQPSPVPGHPRLRGLAHGGQQRGDALFGSPHRGPGSRVVQGTGTGRARRHEGDQHLGRRAAARQLRGADRASAAGAAGGRGGRTSPGTLLPGGHHGRALRRLPGRFGDGRDLG